MRFGRPENTRVDIPAQRRSLRSRPIGPQQPRRQQRIAQMQAAIFMDQERAHDKTRLRIESAKAVQRGEDAFEALDEALVSKSQVFEIPAQTHETLRSIIVSEIGVENDDFGERTQR